MMQLRSPDPLARLAARIAARLAQKAPSPPELGGTRDEGADTETQPKREGSTDEHSTPG